MTNKLALELNSIVDSAIKEITIKVLNVAPDYFWTAASSSTGKYHLNADGTVNTILQHTKEVVMVAKYLIDNPMFGIDKHTRDLVISACILHDTCKRGFDLSNIEYTVHDHPLLVRTLFNKVIRTEEDKKLAEEIFSLIAPHTGPWNTSDYSDVVLPIPSNSAQMVVHLSDYIASRKNIIINIPK